MKKNLREVLADIELLSNWETIFMKLLQPRAAAEAPSRAVGVADLENLIREWMRRHDVALEKLDVTKALLSSVHGGVSAQSNREKGLRKLQLPFDKLANKCRVLLEQSTSCLATIDKAIDDSKCVFESEQASTSTSAWSVITPLSPSELRDRLLRLDTFKGRLAHFKELVDCAALQQVVDGALQVARNQPCDMNLIAAIDNCESFQSTNVKRVWADLQRGLQAAILEAETIQAALLPAAPALDDSHVNDLMEIVIAGAEKVAAVSFNNQLDHPVVRYLQIYRRHKGRGDQILLPQHSIPLTATFDAWLQRARMEGDIQAKALADKSRTNATKLRALGDALIRLGCASKLVGWSHESSEKSEFARALLRTVFAARAEKKLTPTDFVDASDIVAGSLEVKGCTRPDDLAVVGAFKNWLMCDEGLLPPLRLEYNEHVRPNDPLLTVGQVMVCMQDMDTVSGSRPSLHSLALASKLSYFSGCHLTSFKEEKRAEYRNEPIGCGGELESALTRRFGYIDKGLEASGGGAGIDWAQTFRDHKQAMLLAGGRFMAVSVNGSGGLTESDRILGVARSDIGNAAADTVVWMYCKALYRNTKTNRTYFKKRAEQLMQLLAHRSEHELAFKDDTWTPQLLASRQLGAQDWRDE